MRDDPDCTCEEHELDSPHSCPFAEEINDDYRELCTCCPFCTQECAWEI